METINKPKRVQTIAHLKDHLNNHKDAVIIVGPYISKDPVIKLDENLYSRKSLKRTPDKFWEYYKKNVDRRSENNNCYKLIKYLIDEGLIKNVINQNTSSQIAGINLKGSVYQYFCDKCKTVYSSESIDMHSESLNSCELCNGTIRPSVLLYNEKYDQKMYDNIIDILNSTHTLFMIGVDYTEPIIGSMIEKYGTLKEMSNEFNDADNQKIAISIQHDNNFDPNEMLFCEFKVEDDIEKALVRLLKGLK